MQAIQGLKRHLYTAAAGFALLYPMHANRILQPDAAGFLDAGWHSQAGHPSKNACPTGIF